MILLLPIQLVVQFVCPGTWLSDLSHERYEVREKKSSKKVNIFLPNVNCCIRKDLASCGVMNAPIFT